MAGIADAGAAGGRRRDDQPVVNPAEPKDIVGYVREASDAEVQQALTSAINNAPIWFATPPQERAAILERAAVLMESQMPTLMGILVREAGKTFSNAIAEVREAVDFLHYYAGQVRDDFDNETHRPLGPVVCISPWNFPLAIFTGQIAAARWSKINSVLGETCRADAAYRRPGRGDSAGSRRAAGRYSTAAGSRGDRGRRANLR